MWYLPFTNSPRKHTVTYHFSDLQEVYSGNRQIHTKWQLQYLHPPQISTSGKCPCVIIHQTTKATEYMGRCQSHHCHIYAPITTFVTFTPYKFDAAPRTLTGNHLIWCNATCSDFLQRWTKNYCRCLNWIFEGLSIKDPSSVTMFLILGVCYCCLYLSWTVLLANWNSSTTLHLSSYLKVSFNIRYEFLTACHICYWNLI